MSISIGVDRLTNGGQQRSPVMNLAFDERGDVTVVRVGETRLTYPVLASFVCAVRERVEGGAGRMLVDLSAVSYVDSAAIGCLVEVYRLLRDRGGSLRLAGVHPRVETMISMTGVHKFVPLHRDEDDALAAFSSLVGEEA
jgi:anti-sigma B factor antagonist